MKLKNCLMVVALLGAVAPSVAYSHLSEDAALYNAASTPLERALTIATNQVSNAHVVEVEFDDDNGGEYDITLYTNDTKHQLTVGAINGQITKQKQKRLKSSEKQLFSHQKRAKMTLQRAIGRAERAVGGKVYALDFDRERQRDVYEFKVATSDNQTYKVRLDANTGKVIEKKLDN